MADFDRFESHIPPSPQGLSRRPRSLEHEVNRIEVTITPTTFYWRGVAWTRRGEDMSRERFAKVFVVLLLLGLGLLSFCDVLDALRVH
jgi:hypothetical protein